MARGDSFWRRNALGLTCFAVFVVYNDELRQNGQPTVSVWGYVASAEFWYESFQNWQSEFLAVFAIIVLSIYLRQRGSPESKPVMEPHSSTGTA